MDRQPISHHRVDETGFWCGESSGQTSGFYDRNSGADRKASRRLWGRVNLYNKSKGSQKEEQELKDLPVPISLCTHSGQAVSQLTLDKLTLILSTMF